jgi:hypothetical protein
MVFVVDYLRIFVMIVVLVFCHCDKMSKKSNLKGGKIYFGSGFQRAQFMVS